MSTCFQSPPISTALVTMLLSLGYAIPCPSSTATGSQGGLRPYDLTLGLQSRVTRMGQCLPGDNQPSEVTGIDVREEKREGGDWWGGLLRWPHRRRRIMGNQLYATVSSDPLDLGWEDDEDLEHEDDFVWGEDDEGEEPHPLRMQEWNLQMRLPLQLKRKTQQVSFHRDGSVEMANGDKGEWWFDVGGLYWDIKMDNTVIHHKAELHWNVFGTQPRMFRGTVTRDRFSSSFLPPWLFRPVISTFTGFGVGDDTKDTRYPHRQAGVEGPPPKVVPQTDRY
ncbi:unnamed protein product [Choristocarpus tenellus]